MLNRVSKNCVAIAIRVCPNIFIHSVGYRSTIRNLKFSVQTRSIETQGYNHSAEVTKKYAKLDEDKLNELLKDPKYKAMYEKYKLEIEYWKCSTIKIPTTIDASQWLYLLKTQNKTQRRVYMEFLWKLEMKEARQLEKKILHKREREESFEERTSEEKTSDNIRKLYRDTMFHRIRDQTISNFYNGRLISAILYEPKIVFDLGYENDMAPAEQNNCAKQLLLSFSANRMHDHPCDLYFCNVKQDSYLLQRLHKCIPNMYDSDFPLNITSKSYLDTFDRKKLVYLSPHATNVLEKYDPNMVYIIGAMIDKVKPKPLSLQKAKREGIKIVRFPLSEKLPWGTGSAKNLPLNQVLSILLDLRSTDNWDVALQNIPKRKLQVARMVSMQRKMSRLQSRT